MTTYCDQDKIKGKNEESKRYGKLHRGVSQKKKKEKEKLHRGKNMLYEKHGEWVCTYYFLGQTLVPKEFVKYGVGWQIDMDQ